MPKNQPLQAAQNNPQFFWQCAVALGILVFALLSAFFYPTSRMPIDGAQYQNWLNSYQFGYSHRIVTGSLFYLLHGDPTQEKLLAVVPVWHARALFCALALAWLLLFPRIVLSRHGNGIKWLFMAFGAVLLVAPIWRTIGTNIGFMDIWLCLSALLAALALVRNAPWPCLFFCCLGILIHTMMLFFNLLFAMLIVHALLFVPKYAGKWKQWLTCAVFPCLFSLFLYFINDTDSIVRYLNQYGGFLGDVSALVYGFQNPDRHYVFQTNMMALFPRNAVLGFILFSGPPALCALLAAYALSAHGGHWRVAQGASAAMHRAAPAVAPWLEALNKSHLFFLLILASIFVMIINFVSIDWSRHFYMNWWGLAVALIYLVWNMPAGGDKHKQVKSGKKGKNTTAVLRQPRLTAATILFALTAYIYGGAPALVVSHINRPYQFPCQQYCISWLTANPLGDVYRGAFFETLVDAILPIHGDAKNIHHLDELSPLKYADGKLVIPEGHTGRLFGLSFTQFGATRIKFTVRHESSAPPPLQLLVNGQVVPAPRQTEQETVWQVAFDPGIPFLLPEYTVQQAGVAPAYAVTGFSIEKF